MFRRQENKVYAVCYVVSVVNCKEDVTLRLEERFWRKNKKRRIRKGCTWHRICSAQQFRRLQLVSVFIAIVFLVQTPSCMCSQPQAFKVGQILKNRATHRVLAVALFQQSSIWHLHFEICRMKIFVLGVS